MGPAITSRDVRYAFERLVRPRDHSIHAFYFTVIRGFDAYRRGRAKTIAGIRTPTVRTIVFELTRPVGDFPHRLTIPATAPVPPEVARCFDRKQRGYGRDVVASGPYMIEGADDVKLGSCASIRPMRGIADEQLTLVRNPRYDPATDSTAARESNPDRFVFIAPHAGAARTAFQLAGKVLDGELDDAILYTLPKGLQRYTARAAAYGGLRVNHPYWRYYVSMNLTQPPFDDVHVRRALSWVLDRRRLLDAAGGRLGGSPAQHILPDALLGGRLRDFAPFKTPGDRGDPAKARAEMAKSKYANRRGVCTAGACKNVPLSPLVFCTCYAIGQRIAPFIRADAAKIGIRFEYRSHVFDQLLMPSKNISIAPNVEWVGDYAEPAAFLERTFAGSSIVPTPNLNTSLVGLTRARAQALGVKGRVAGVPSVDRDLARCGALRGARRLDCYAALDRKLSTQIVPWIPYLWRSRINILGRQVARWRYDQSTGATSFAHVAVRG